MKQIIFIHLALVFATSFSQKFALRRLIRSHDTTIITIDSVEKTIKIEKRYLYTSPLKVLEISSRPDSLQLYTPKQRGLYIKAKTVDFAGNLVSTEKSFNDNYGPHWFSSYWLGYKKREFNTSKYKLIKKRKVWYHSRTNYKSFYRETTQDYDGNKVRKRSKNDPFSG